MKEDPRSISSQRTFALSAPARLFFQPRPRALDQLRVALGFIFSQNFGGTDEAIAKVKVILEAHDKAATRFFNELFGGASSLSDAGVYAHHLIDNNFKPARSRSDKAYLDVFLDFLRAFHIACNTAIKQLSDPSSDRRGSPWKIWLNRLAEIIEEDKSVRGEGSVDHQFVGELQKCLPL
jgi:hypothetical protein